jgi:hypothetical protein
LYIPLSCQKILTADLPREITSLCPQGRAISQGERRRKVVNSQFMPKVSKACAREGVYSKFMA